MFPLKQNLSKEQQQALKILENNLPNFEKMIPLRLCDLSFENTTQVHNCFFFDGHLAASRIPKKMGWKWNQSRSKVEITSEKGDFRLSFFKLNTRKAPGEDISNIPHFKVWIYNITNTYSSAKSSFFWCEKGREPEPSLDNKFLEELSFLGEFVSKKDAFELGWSNEKPEELDFDITFGTYNDINDYFTPNFFELLENHVA